MKSKLFESIISLILVAVLMVPFLTVHAASETDIEEPAAKTSSKGTDSASIEKKEEVVYATLDDKGSAQSVYIVNHFEVKKAGNITDYGNYSSVSNLTSTEAIQQDGKAVTFYADKGNFYYQGNMSSTTLPWQFGLSYKLDGKEASAEEIPGAKGKLEINIQSKQNKSVDTTFYSNYMLQISLTLDMDKCSNIVSDGATMASAGKNQVVTHTVMPGKDGDVKVTANVENFAMEGVSISATPYTMAFDSFDTSAMTDGITTLADAISSLNDAVGELAKGIGDMKSGSAQLANGADAFGDGLNQLNNNSAQLVDASAQINTSLAQIVTSLSGSTDGLDLSSLSQLPKGLSDLAKGLKSISSGMSTLKTGFESGYKALDAAVQSIPAYSITEGQINSLYANTDPSQYELLGQLVESYTAAQTVKGTYAAVKSAFDAVGTTLDTLSASVNTISGSLSTMSTQISTSLSGMDITSQLSELTTGLGELSKSYGQFHTGLTEYTGGVSELTVGYAELRSGIASLDKGIGSLGDGANKLYDGTTELNNEVADMPETMEIEIENMIEEYTGLDFDPVSFTSPKNKDIDFVQFVFITAGVKIAEPEPEPEQEPTQKSIFERFLALFTTDDNKE